VSDPIRVAIVVGDDIARLGFEQVVLRAPGFEVVAVGNGPDALGGGAAPDMVIAGMGPDLNEAELRAILAVCPRVLCFARPERRAEAVDAGVAAFLAAASDAESLLSLVTLVASGGTYFPDDGFPPEILSPREREVLACVATGCTDREIGERLGISMRTAQSHLDRIREKTGRRRRAELTALAYELGLVQVPG
jgi:DNA-binding NarL/FixJ family response regulator